MNSRSVDLHTQFNHLCRIVDSQNSDFLSADPAQRVSEDTQDPIFRWETGPNPKCLIETFKEFPLGPGDPHQTGFPSLMPDDPDSGFWRMLHRCNPEKRKVRILGRYFPTKRTIEYYFDNSNLDSPKDEITKIHERFHAVHHLLPDPVSGEIWTDFTKAGPFYLELLAQLFTYKYFQATSKLTLTKKMVEMAEGQSCLYQTFLMFSGHDPGEVMAMYWHIREYGRIGGWVRRLEQKAMKECSIPREIGSWAKSSNQQRPPAKDAPEEKTHPTRKPSTGCGSRAQWKSCNHYLIQIPTEELVGHPLHEGQSIQSMQTPFRKKYDHLSPGTKGFILLKRAGLLGVVEIAGPWQPDPTNKNLGSFPLVCTQAWHPGLPFKYMKPYFKGARIGPGPYPITDEAVIRIETAWNMFRAIAKGQFGELFWDSGPW